MKEQKIASFQQEKTRLQLLKITYDIPESILLYEDKKPKIINKIRYEVRLNRKVIDKSISEYEMRKLFATYVQNIVLQLKMY